MEQLYLAIKKFTLKTDLVAVALSGGADSTALLLAARQNYKNVVAMHIRHGLQAADPLFARQCQNLCQQLKVPLFIAQVNAKNLSGQSPEDAARNARYRALASLAKQHSIDHVLLAQHADDQVETILLALSRGAGVAGLAAMPSDFTRYEVQFHRPFLTLSAGQIRQALTTAGIDWIEDPTNSDCSYTRNKIRLKLLPILEQLFPHFRTSFARSAQLAAQSNLLIEQLGALDWKAMGEKISIKQLQQLPRERQANLLRYWLKQNYAIVGNAAQLNELLKQIKACTTRAHSINIKFAAGYIQRRDDGLTYLPEK